MPSSNVKFWEQKFKRTVERDKEVIVNFKKKGGESLLFGSVSSKMKSYWLKN